MFQDSQENKLEEVRAEEQRELGSHEEQQQEQREEESSFSSTTMKKVWSTEKPKSFLGKTRVTAVE